MHHGTVWGTLWYILVVYHLSGQNSRFAVLGNGNKVGACGKFHPDIAFTICTNHFHSPINDRKSLKLVSKMALKKWDTVWSNLTWKTGETGQPFQNSVASGNLPLGRPEKSCSFPTTTIIHFKDARERRSKFNFPKTEQFSRLSRNLKLGSALRFITLRLGQV